MYNGETLSVLFEYSSSERDDVPFSAVAQLPVKLVLNLATDSFGEQDFNWYVFELFSLSVSLSLSPVVRVKM